jgi:hypothetical protein
VAVGVGVSVSGRRTIFDERVFLAQSIPNVPGLLEATPMTPVEVSTWTDCPNN